MENFVPSNAALRHNRHNRAMFRYSEAIATIPLLPAECFALRIGTTEQATTPTTKGETIELGGGQWRREKRKQGGAVQEKLAPIGVAELQKRWDSLYATFGDSLLADDTETEFPSLVSAEETAARIGDMPSRGDEFYAERRQASIAGLGASCDSSGGDMGDGVG